MPYFKKQNLLFIHIPKTGGTSLEHYLSKKYNTTLDRSSLYGISRNSRFNRNIGNIESSFQHLRYSTIFEKKNNFGITFPVKVISIVRNPYTKIISDLFYDNLIKINSTPLQVYNVIKKYITLTKKDNHNIPQHHFLTENGKLIDCTIFKTETLTEDLKEYGFTDFDLFENVNKNKISIETYLNKESIEVINSFYDLDFSFFNYTKIS